MLHPAPDRRGPDGRAPDRHGRGLRDPAGRSRAEFAGLVGDFINMNAMRADLSGNPTFAALLSQMRQTVLDALAETGVGR